MTCDKLKLMNGLTRQQDDFCMAYVANHYNAKKAYQDVMGEYNENVYHTWMRNPLVQRRIDEIRQEKMEQWKIDADRVIEELAMIAFADLDDKKITIKDKLKALELLQRNYAQRPEGKQEVIEVKVCN